MKNKLLKVILATSLISLLIVAFNVQASGGYKIISGGGSGSGDVGAGTTGQVTYYASSGTTLTATSTIFIDSSSNVGIGTTTPGFLLGVDGTFRATGASSFGSSLTVTGETILSATTTLANNYWLRGLDYSGAGYINMFKPNESNQIEVGGTMAFGDTMNLVTDGGLLRYLNMNVTSSAADGTEEGYTFAIDNTDVLTVKALSDGAGGIDTLQTVIDPTGTFGSNGFPSLAFGDGDSGIRELSDDTMTFVVAGGTNIAYFDANSFRDADNTGWGLMNEVSSATNPTLVPYSSDSDTGIGRAGANQLSFDAGGNEILRLTDTTATSTATFATDNAGVGACLKLEDTDGAGYTYLTVLNGTLTATTTSCE